MSARKYSQEEKERYVEEFINSGECQSAFARSRGIPEATFRGWLNSQNDNDISFGSINVNNDEVMFSFKYQHINIELQKGFDKKLLKKIMGVFMNA